MNVGVASNDRRMFEIILPNVGKIVCETSTKLSGPTAGRGRAKEAGQAAWNTAQRGTDKGDRGLLRCRHGVRPVARTLASLCDVSARGLTPRSRLVALEDRRIGP